MIKLIAKLVLLTILTLGINITAFAGEKKIQPVYWLDFWAQNNTSEKVMIRVKCEKGYFFAELAPGEFFGYGIDYEIPPNGFSRNWLAQSGDVTVTVNETTTVKHAKCLAELEEILVTVNPKKKEGVFKVEVDLIE